jgi:hypothetical protein
MNILTQKGLGVTFSVKCTKKAVFVEGHPEKSSKGHYILTAKAGAKSYSTNCIGSRELFSKAWAILHTHFPQAYEKAVAIAKAQKAENRAKVRKPKRTATGIDAEALLNLLSRQGRGKGTKGNGGVTALFL